MDIPLSKGTFSASRKTYAAVFLITAATLLLELLLTRIWSVTMWYHFAFVAVSLAMFGTTGGALSVYLLPKFFTPEKTQEHLALSALSFGISITVCFLCQLAIPFMPDRSLSGLFAMALSYLIVSIPFIFSGIAITLALTRFPNQVGYVYAADLVGASCGCLLFAFILNIIDGPSAVIFSSLLASLSAALLTVNKRDRRRTMVVCCAIGALLLINVCSAQINQPLIRLLWVKAEFESRPSYERWNSISRISIDGDPQKRFSSENPVTSKEFGKKKGLKELNLFVDATYSTPLPAFTGNYDDAEGLKHDISFPVHYIRPNARVLIIGIGGGRDILAALTFHQPSIKAIEINNIFTDLLLKTYADFSGNFARDPRVRLINDEARSFVSRQKEKFDIIQLSFISTGTATGTGAYALTENSLYTQEAWKTFLDHLTDSGVLTCTRNYFVDKDGHPQPGELQRLVALARSALEKEGIRDPQDHIVCIADLRKYRSVDDMACVTILVSKLPFSKNDIDTLLAVAKENNFTVLLTPDFASDATLRTLATGIGLKRLSEEFPTRLDAPTDNSPFFFYILRFTKIFSVKVADVGTYTIYTKALEILVELLVVVVLLTVACFLVPLSLTNKKLNLKRDLPLLSFFAAVGFGFMFIEVSQLQRLAIFLGHPTYSLTVVLFSLLLSSGIGSYLTGAIGKTDSYKADIVRLSLLCAATIIYALVSQEIIIAMQSATMPMRIAATVGMLFPVGLLLGMAIPLGLRLAAQRSPEIMPWLWGANGATSVCASVLAVVVSINLGLSTSYWIGVACYLVALFAFCSATKIRRVT